MEAEGLLDDLQRESRLEAILQIESLAQMRATVTALREDSAAKTEGSRWFVSRQQCAGQRLVEVWLRRYSRRPNVHENAESSELPSQHRYHHSRKTGNTIISGTFTRDGRMFNVNVWRKACDRAAARHDMKARVQSSQSRLRGR